MNRDTAARMREQLDEALRRVAEGRTRENVEREERKATLALGFVECPGDHSGPTGRSAAPPELVESREPLPEHTRALLSDPRLAQRCGVCGAAL
jgi:hypothetical protein